MEDNKSELPTITIPFSVALKLYMVKIRVKAIRAGLSISAIDEMEKNAETVIDLRLIQFLREVMAETPVQFGPNNPQIRRHFYPQVYTTLDPAAASKPTDDFSGDTMQDSIDKRIPHGGLVTIAGKQFFISPILAAGQDNELPQIENENIPTGSSPEDRVALIFSAAVQVYGDILIMDKMIKSGMDMDQATAWYGRIKDWDDEVAGVIQLLMEKSPLWTARFPTEFNKAEPLWVKLVPNDTKEFHIPYADELTARQPS